MSEPTKQWLTRVEADVAFLRLSAPEAVAAIEAEARASQPLTLDVEQLADALHRAGECRMWPLGNQSTMTHREAAAQAEAHATRHFITARVVAAEYERLGKP